MTREQRYTLRKISDRQMKAEKQMLSNNRYKKMKLLIIREVHDAIHETADEHLASVMTQSFIEQDEQQSTYDMPDFPLH